MKQTELNRAVARVTGESVSTIQRLGFLLAEPGQLNEPHDLDEDEGPYVIDWDALQEQRAAGAPDNGSDLH